MDKFEFIKYLLDRVIPSLIIGILLYAGWITQDWLLMMIDKLLTAMTHW